MTIDQILESVSTIVGTAAEDPRFYVRLAVADKMYQFLRILEEKTNLVEEIGTERLAAMYSQLLRLSIKVSEEAKEIDLNQDEPLCQYLQNFQNISPSDLVRSSFSLVTKLSPEMQLPPDQVLPLYLMEGDSSMEVGYSELETGRIRSANEQFEKALYRYLKALEIKPNNCRTHTLVGKTLLLLQRPAESIPYFDKALALGISENLHFLVYQSRGQAKLELGQYAEALSDLDQSIHLMSKEPEAYSYKGEALRHLQRPQEAEQAYRVCLNLVQKIDPIDREFEIYTAAIRAEEGLVQLGSLISTNFKEEAKKKGYNISPP